MDLNTVAEVARPRKREDLPAWRAGDAWLAGGTWLFSEPQPAVSRLIDIVDLGWSALQVDASGLQIAATCKIAELDAMALPAAWLAAPLFNQCCRSFLASFKVWNAATVGGNLCMALPAGPMISLTVALDGTCTVWGGDGTERRIAVTDFVLGPQHNGLRPGELLRSVFLPVSALRRRTAFRQISLTPHGRSAVLLIGTHATDEPGFSLTVTAATRRPVTLAFADLPSAADLRDALEGRIPAAQYYDDIHGAPAWRRHLTLLYAEEIRSELAARSGA